MKFLIHLKWKYSIIFFNLLIITKMKTNNENPPHLEGLPK